MTQEEKRIRIIEFCKWKDISDICHHRKVTYQCATEEGLMTVGDPFEDLNAVHEIENTLTRAQSIEYAINLSGGGFPIYERSAFLLLNSTASERVDALGQTLGLWK